MTATGVLINNVVRQKSANQKRKKRTGQDIQNITLKKLLNHARMTEFGNYI